MPTAPTNSLQESDLSIDRGSARSIPALDPTARLDDDFDTPHQINTSKGFLIPTSWSEFRAFGVRHYLIKLLSILLLGHGIHGLYKQLLALFVVFPQLPTLFQTLDYSQDIYTSLIYEFILITTTGVIETIIGVSLALKHSSVIKNLHVFVGVALFLLSYILHQYISPLNLEHLEPTSNFISLLF